MAGKRIVLGAMLVATALATLGAAVVGWRALFGGRGVYTITQVGAGAPVRLYGINNRGVAVGCAPLPGIDYRCFTYADGVATPLEVPGATSVLAVAVNDRGQVAARFMAPGRHGYQGVLFDGGRPTPFFATPPGGVTLPAGLDGTGGVVGTLRRDGADAIGKPGTSGFLYKDGVLTTIDRPGAIITDAMAVNAHGTVVGTYQRGDGSGRRGFIYDSGVFRDLDVPGGVVINQITINDAGQIAGVWVSEDLASHVFLYDGGRGITSYDIPGVRGVVHVSLNGRGWIAGYGFRAAEDEFRGFLIVNGTVVPDPGGIEGFQIEAINDAGQLAGLGVVDGRPAGIIATPRAAAR